MGEFDDISWEIFRQKLVRELVVNMSKSINKQQIEILLNFVLTQPDIARGFHKGSKEELARFWRKVGDELNSAGPPMKTVSEWKKVWADQKKYVRHKAAQNLRASKSTGGGPNQEVKFSATEEQIYTLIGMKESVEGVARTFGLGSTVSTGMKESVEGVARTFGLGSTVSTGMKESVEGVARTFGLGSTVSIGQQNKENMNLSFDDEMLTEFFDESEVNPNQVEPSKRKTAEQPRQKTNFLSESLENHEGPSFQTPPPKKKRDEKIQTKTHSYPPILDEEFAVQKEMCETTKENLQATKKVYRSIDRLHDMFKHHFSVTEKRRQDEAEEAKRHNLAMENLKLKEIEYKAEKNRRLLEIEELKLNMKQ